MALQISITRFNREFPEAYLKITDTSFRWADSGDVVEIVAIIHADQVARLAGAQPIEATAYQVSTTQLEAHQEPTDTDPRQPAYRWMVATVYPEAINV